MIPSFGLEAGGETVRVEGADFLPGCEVRFGGALATVTEVAADGRSVKVVVPPGAAGAAGVEVKNLGGLSGLRLGAYRYLVSPAISAVIPADRPFNSREQIRLEGSGLYSGSQVTFGGVPARAVTLLSDGALNVEVPDGVTGKVDLRLTTPGATGGAFATRTGGFTFTLSAMSTLTQGADAVATVGSVLLIAKGDELIALDLSIPESPYELSRSAGVAEPTAISVLDGSAFLAGRGGVVRYALGTCGTAPRATCEPAEQERISLAPGDVAPTAIVATPGAAYVALGGANELVLLGRLNGAFEVVARTFLPSGNIRALDRVSGALAVLVESSTSTRLELRSYDDGALALLSSVEAMPRPAYDLAVDGNRLAVGAGNTVQLLDASELDAPHVEGSWTAEGAVRAVSLLGPWAWVNTSGRGVWLDTTDGVVERTWAPALSYAQQMALVGGVAVATDASRLRLYELPYPVLSGTNPRPGAALAPGAVVTASVSSRLPLEVAANSHLSLFDDGGPIAGDASVSGASVRFAPAAPLVAGQRYTASLTLAPTPFVGGNARAPYRYALLGGRPATGILVGSVSPDHGPVAGNFAVELVGEGLAQVTEVRFGAAVAPLLEPASDSRLLVQAPAAVAAGPVTVELSTSAGETFRLEGGFSYVAPFAVSAITPARVALEGGWVTATGTGFTQGLQIRVNDAVVATRTLTATSIDFLVPAGAPGYVSVAFSQPGLAPLLFTQSVRRADTQPPAVVAWEPMDQVGYQNVPLDAVFTVRFDEAIDPASVGNAKLLRTSGSVVASTVAIGADGSSLTLRPSAPLTSAGSYTLAMGGIADLGGNAISSANKGFRAVDVVAPTVSVRIAGREVAQGDTFAGNVVWPFEVLATDDAGVRTTSLSIDGVAVPRSGDGKYRYQWPLSAAGTSSELVAIASDWSNNERRLSLTVTIVSDVPPTVSFSQPAVTELTLEEGGSLQAAISATDNSKVASIELRLDGVSQKRSTGLTAATASLSHTLRMAGVSSAPETRILTALAIDDAGLVGSAAPIAITVTPDATAPAVAFASPLDGAHLLAKMPVDLRATVTDTNPIRSVTFKVDGEVVATKSDGRWSTAWTVPDLTVARPAVLRIEATDARGNVGFAERTVTLEPPAMKPMVSIDGPTDNGVVYEGNSVRVTVSPSAPRGIRQVLITFDGKQASLNGYPWYYDFVAPTVGPSGRRIVVTAVTEDRAGETSLPAMLDLRGSQPVRHPAHGQRDHDAERAGVRWRLDPPGSVVRKQRRHHDARRDGGWLAVDSAGRRALDVPAAGASGGRGRSGRRDRDVEWRHVDRRGLGFARGLRRGAGHVPEGRGRRAHRQSRHARRAGASRARGRAGPRAARASRSSRPRADGVRGHRRNAGGDELLGGSGGARGAPGGGRGARAAVRRQSLGALVDAAPSGPDRAARARAQPARRHDRGARGSKRARRVARSRPRRGGARHRDPGRAGLRPW